MKINKIDVDEDRSITIIDDAFTAGELDALYTYCISLQYKVCNVSNFDIQNITDNVRDYEINYLKQKGIGVSSLHKKYSINENLMGATISGSEIDVWKAPKAESYVLCNLPEDYPKRTKKILIRFDKGKPVAINGSKVKGPELLRHLNKIGGKYGIGRSVFCQRYHHRIKGQICL